MSQYLWHFLIFKFEGYLYDIILCDSNLNIRSWSYIYQCQRFALNMIISCDRISWKIMLQIMNGSRIFSAKIFSPNQRKQPLKKSTISKNSYWTLELKMKDFQRPWTEVQGLELKLILRKVQRLDCKSSFKTWQQNIELNEELKYKREQGLIGIHITREFIGILWA